MLAHCCQNCIHKDEEQLFHSAFYAKYHLSYWGMVELPMVSGKGMCQLKFSARLTSFAKAEVLSKPYRR